VREAVGARPQLGQPAPAGGGLRRVSVYADSAHVDLVLSAEVPIGSLIPVIVDVLAARCGFRAEPMAIRHQLSLPGNVSLNPSKTLLQNGIRDGTTLILTSSSTELTAPRFDDTAEGVSASLAAAMRPWTRSAARLIGALLASWLAGMGAAVLMRTVFVTNDARHSGEASVAAAVGFIALLAAPIAHRGFRARTAGLTLGLVATGFTALAGLLVVPGVPGAANALLAMAAAAAVSASLRVMGCCAVIFTALCCFTAAAAAATLVAAASAVPLQAIGAGSAAISLVLLEASAPVSIMLAGLSPELSSEPERVHDMPTPHQLNTKAIRANTWLTSLLAGFSASAALGAIGAAGAPYTAGGSRSLGITFATVTGGVLLLRSRAHHDLARSVPLIVSGIATLSVTLVITAATYPQHALQVAAGLTMLSAATLCLGFITHAMVFSPIVRRSVELFEYLALAVIAPLACWICGLYSAARGLNLT
jgi:type VII secretion integral membrane protein EccD